MSTILMLLALALAVVSTSWALTLQKKVAALHRAAAIPSQVPIATPTVDPSAEIAELRAAHTAESRARLEAQAEVMSIRAEIQMVKAVAQANQEAQAQIAEVKAERDLQMEKVRAEVELARERAEHQEQLAQLKKEHQQRMQHLESLRQENKMLRNLSPVLAREFYENRAQTLEERCTALTHQSAELERKLGTAREVSADPAEQCRQEVERCTMSAPLEMAREQIRVCQEEADQARRDAREMAGRVLTRV